MPASTVVLLLEDVHWIDRASEEMLSKLIEAGAQPNLLVIHTRRPEYLPRSRGGAGVTTGALKPSPRATSGMSCRRDSARRPCPTR
jgi:predicted ATPase